MAMAMHLKKVEVVPCKETMGEKKNVTVDELFDAFKSSLPFPDFSSYPPPSPTSTVGLKRSRRR